MSFEIIDFHIFNLNITNPTKIFMILIGFFPKNIIH